MLSQNKIRSIISASFEDFEQAISGDFNESDFPDYLVGFARLGYTVEKFWTLKDKKIFTLATVQAVELYMDQSCLYFSTPEMEEQYAMEQVEYVLNLITDDEHSLVHAFFNEEFNDEFKKINDYFNFEANKRMKNGN